MNRALLNELTQKSQTLASFEVALAVHQTFTSWETASAAIEAIAAELEMPKHMAFLSCPVVRLTSAGVKVTPRSPRQITQGYDVAIYPDANGDQGRYLYLSVNVKS